MDDDGRWHTRVRIAAVPRPDPAPLPSASKDQWRAWARRRRGLLDWTAVGERVVGHLAAHLAGVEAGRLVVLYSALPHEPNVDAVATAGALRHLRFGLTRTAGPQLTVHPFDGVRERHRFGFAQPVAASPALAATEALFVVPGLAFDRMGVRLGNGGGYYDRLAETVPGASWLGVTAAALVVAELPAEPHDLAVDLLVTEEGCKRPER